MALIPVSKETLGKKRVKPISDLKILANVPHCEILGSEFAHVSNSFPIFFVEKEKQFIPLALFSLEPERNLFVNADGEWDGLYLPAAFRRYPFTIVRVSETSNDQALMVESDMLSDDEGEPIFGETDEDDQTGKSLIGRVIQFTNETSQSGAQTAEIVNRIAATGIIVSAHEAMNVPPDAPFLPGFFAVSERKFMELSNETFLELRRIGALPLIYLHLGSLGQLSRLQVRRNALEGAKTVVDAAHSPAGN